MNEKRKRILDYIKGVHEREGRYPVITEIAEALQLQRQTAKDNVDMLAHLGYLRMEYGRILDMRLPGEPALKAEVG